VEERRGLAVEPHLAERLENLLVRDACGLGEVLPVSLYFRSLLELLDELLFLLPKVLFLQGFLAVVEDIRHAPSSQY
jgi:hypothetical protein